jgi:hypothetical protein
MVLKRVEKPPHPLKTMTDQLLAKLRDLYPNLDWQQQTASNHVELTGYATYCDRDTPVFTLVAWGENAGFHAGRVDLYVLGCQRPQFLDLADALDWLGWYQGAMGPNKSS